MRDVSFKWRERVLFASERERESERGRLAPTNNNISEAGNGRQERAQVKG